MKIFLLSLTTLFHLALVFASAPSADKLNGIQKKYDELKSITSTSCLAFEIEFGQFYKYSYSLVSKLKVKEILAFLDKKPVDFILMFFYLLTRRFNILMEHKETVIRIINGKEEGWDVRRAFIEFSTLTGLIIEVEDNVINISSNVLSDEISLLTIRSFYQDIFKEKLYQLTVGRFLNLFTTILKPHVDLKHQAECFLVSFVTNPRNLDVSIVFKKFIFPLLDSPHHNVEIKNQIILSLPELIDFFDMGEDKRWETLDLITNLVNLIKSSNTLLLESIFYAISTLFDNIPYDTHHAKLLKKNFNKAQILKIIEHLSSDEDTAVLKDRRDHLVRKINGFELNVF